MVVYTTVVAHLRSDQLEGGFFEGWADPLSPARHLQILRASPHVVVALEGESAVGFVTAISDGVRAAFVTLLEVLPAHRGRGVGTELIRRLLDQLQQIDAVDLACDPEIQPFYARLGTRR